MADNHTPLAAKPGEPESVKKAPESEPIPAKAQEIKVEPQREKKLAPEVVEYIKKSEETIKIPDVLRDIGVTAGKDEEFQAVDGPTMPLSDQQISDGLKQPMNSSMRWLAQILLYILQQAHYTIKVVHGNVKRIVKP